MPFIGKTNSLIFHCFLMIDIFLVLPQNREHLSFFRGIFRYHSTHTMRRIQRIGKPQDNAVIDSNILA